MDQQQSLQHFISSRRFRHKTRRATRAWSLIQINGSFPSQLRWVTIIWLIFRVAILQTVRCACIIRQRSKDETGLKKFCLFRSFCVELPSFALNVRRKRRNKRNKNGNKMGPGVGWFKVKSKVVWLCCEVKTCVHLIPPSNYFDRILKMFSLFKTKAAMRLSKIKRKYSNREGELWRPKVFSDRRNSSATLIRKKVKEKEKKFNFAITNNRRSRTIILFLLSCRDSHVIAITTTLQTKWSSSVSI